MKRLILLICNLGIIFLLICCSAINKSTYVKYPSVKPDSIVVITIPDTFLMNEYIDRVDYIGGKFSLYNYLNGRIDNFNLNVLNEVEEDSILKMLSIKTCDDVIDNFQGRFNSIIIFFKEDSIVGSIKLCFYSNTFEFNPSISNYCLEMNHNKVITIRDFLYSKGYIHYTNWDIKMHNKITPPSPFKKQ